MNVRPRVLRLSAAAWAAALSACAATAGTTVPGPAPSPPACLPPVPAFVQSYPLSGATGIPAAAGQIVVAAPAGISPGNWAVQLVPASGNHRTVIGSALGGPPNPLPSPIAPLPSGDNYFGATVPPLDGGVQYQVQVYEPQVSCLAPLGLGVFSTQ